jgi:hypothetical protein
MYTLTGSSFYDGKGCLTKPSGTYYDYKGCICRPGIDSFYDYKGILTRPGEAFMMEKDV